MTFTERVLLWLARYDLIQHHDAAVERYNMALRDSERDFTAAMEDAALAAWQIANDSLAIVAMGEIQL
jgi:hypothetical protein